MDKNYLKYYKPGLIIPFILITGTLLSLLVSEVISIITVNTDISYYQFPSTTILIGLLILSIDKWLWKYKPFKWLLWLEDISGRYEGEITFNNYLNGFKEKRAFALEIEQTGSLIKLNTYFNNASEDTSQSVSKQVNLNKDDFGNISIFMNYHNEGNPVSKIPEHYGTNILKYSNGILTGKYYTNKNPQTSGLMKAIYSTKRLKKSY